MSEIVDKIIDKSSETPIDGQGPNDAENKKFVGRIAELSSSINENVAKFEKTILTGEGRKLFEEFKKTQAAYRPLLDKVIELGLQNKNAEAQAILQKAVEIVGECHAEVHTELIEGDAAESIIDVARTRNSNVIVMGSRGLGRL